MITASVFLADFNSIKVRLEQPYSQFTITDVPHFNSIKVRLEHMSSLFMTTFANAFQFHKGAIRTEGEIELAYSGGNFNSIKVRLEPSVFHLNYKLGN